jgi:DNA-directed RNA polymerase subunit F
MKPETNFWKRIGIQDWFLSDTGTASSDPKALTPNEVYKYIIEKFKESISSLSFADRVVFYHEYIICFNPEDYKDFMENKRGIFGLIVQEAVKKFYEILTQSRTELRVVEPSSNKWVFRFVSNPDYGKGDKGFIGRLLPGTTQKEENLKVTFIPRQTGMAQTFDINQENLKGFTFYSEGYYEVPYVNDLAPGETVVKNVENIAYARFETILPDKAYSGHKVEYFMAEDEIIVSGSEESRDEGNIFKIPSEWVDTPHLRIKYNKSDSKFYLTSFGEKTMVNEKEIERSDINSPVWTELPLNSKMILNGIIGVNIFKG